MTKLLLVFTMVVCLVVPAAAMGNEEESLAVGTSSVQEGLSADLVEIVEQVWSGGPYSVPLHSFYKHYQRHRYDRGMDEVRCPSDYLQRAMDMYRDTMENPDKYRVVERTSGETGETIYKYTHPETRYFIMHDQKGTIHTFGGLRYGGKHHAKRNERRIAEMIRRQQEEG